MSGSNYIAPVNVDGLYIIDCSMHLEPEPAEEMNVTLDIDVQRGNLHVDENSIARKNVTLSVKTGMSTMSDASDRRFYASATVLINISVGTSPEDDRESINQYLDANAVSIAYSHARSAIMTITGLSPLGPYVIPAVLPYELLKDNES